MAGTAMPVINRDLSSLARISDVPFGKSWLQNSLT